MRHFHGTIQIKWTIWIFLSSGHAIILGQLRKKFKKFPKFDVFFFNCFVIILGQLRKKFKQFPYKAQLGKMKYPCYTPKENSLELLNFYSLIEKLGSYFFMKYIIISATFCCPLLFIFWKISTSFTTILKLFFFLFFRKFLISFTSLFRSLSLFFS